MSNKEDIGFRVSERTYVAVAAVQDGLVRSKALADTGQGLDDPQSQLLSLLGLVHRDILDMSHCSQTPQELLLHEHASSSNHLIIRLGNDHDGEVYLVGFDDLTCIHSSGRRAE